MKRHELIDQRWELLTPFFPPRPRPRGGQRKDDRPALNGLSGRLNTGAPWRDRLERYGKWPAVHDRFTQLRRRGLLDRIPEALPTRLDEKGLIDGDLGCVAGSSVRASRAAAGASEKRYAASRPQPPRAAPGAVAARKSIW